MIISKLIFVGLYTISLILFCKRMLHIFQLEEYEALRLFRWGIKSPKYLFIPGLILASIISIVCVIIVTTITKSINLGLIISSALCLIATTKAQQRISQIKKPLVFTNRAKRIISASSLIAFLISVSFLFIFDFTGEVFIQCILIFILIFALPILAMICVTVGNLILTPIESIIRWRYEQSARLILGSSKDLKKIGITGSYGKTTTKVIVSHFLQSKYKTLPTPQSYNTFLGIIRVIREELKPFHEIFVVEMGAYIPGEIRKICDLVHPEIAVITEVGPQHLERFGTIENVARAKYEIVQGLPGNGTIIIYEDNPLCSALASRAKNEGYNVLRYGISSNNSILDVYASEIKYSLNGTSFQLHIKGSTARQVEIPLLGYHNVLNVLAATLVALQFEISVDEIIRNYSSIHQIPHRLQVINSGNGITVIDDSYNSNIVGVHNAIDLLEKIPMGRKIIVTPGIIELGEIEYIENYRFGEHIGKVCTYVILVGLKRTKPIQEGLHSSGFPSENMIVVPSLNDATGELSRIARPGDIVLFSNDLPDNYSE